jgi:hypothetical protein
MDDNYSIEKRESYMYMKVYGRYDYDRFVSLMNIANEECINEKVSRIIVDALTVEHANISTMDRFKLGEKVAGIVGSRIKVAVIWPPEYINRFTATVALNRGGVMQIFGNIDEAKKWLLSEI